MNPQEYKQFLINGILEFQTHNQFSRKELQKKTIRALEIIYDNVK